MCGGEPGVEIGEIAVDHGFHVGVEGGDDGALVLAEGRVDLAGEGDEHFRVALGDDLAGTALVRLVEERKQEHDRDRARAGGDQLVGGGGNGAFVELPQHLAGGADALGDLAAEPAGRQERRRFRRQRQVVHLVAHLAADLQHVTEALGGDQADAGALALEHCVGRHRRAVHEPGDLLRPQIPVRLHACQRLQHRDAGVLAGARDLHDPGRCAGTAYDHVGERAADIDPDQEVSARAHCAAHASCAARG